MVASFVAKSESFDSSIFSCNDEECLDERECGNEIAPPRQECLIMGLNVLPLLPVIFFLSTLLGALVMLIFLVPALSVLAGIGVWCLQLPLATVYVVTLGCMLYTMSSNPGEMPVEGGGACTGLSKPRRAHKAWTHIRPIRRYDHYCKWLKNSIGLLNHREFVIMLGGLVFTGVLGGALSGMLVLAELWGVFHTDGRAVDAVRVVLGACHFGYSCVVVYIAKPIFQFHVLAVSRNELAKENRDDTYREDVSSSDENPDKEDDGTIYRPDLNPFDHGCSANCSAFWCEARWAPDQRGDF